MCSYVIYLSCLLLLCGFIHPIDLLGELSKVRDNEFLIKSLRQQHDVVAYTPKGGHMVS